MSLINEIEKVVEEINNNLPDNMTLEIEHFEDVLDQEQRIYTHMKVVLLLVDEERFETNQSNIIMLCDANTSKSQIKQILKSKLAKHFLK